MSTKGIALFTIYRSLPFREVLWGAGNLRTSTHNVSESQNAERDSSGRLRTVCTQLTLFECDATRLAILMLADMDPDGQSIFTDYALMPTFRDLMEANTDIEVS